MSPSPLPSPSPSPSPPPFSISEDLIPIRPAKSAGTTTISFDDLLSPPLQLHEDLKEGCGGQLWPAGTVLAKYLLTGGRLEEFIRGKRVVELGAGGGLVGLALALGLQQRLSTEITPPIVISDLDVLLPLQAHNIALNSLSSDSIISIELPWGSELPSSLPASHRPPDILLAADCVYFEPAFPLLLQTMDRLISEGTICCFCMKKRRKADMRFVATLKKKFTVSEVEAEDSIWEKGVFLYIVRKKPPPEDRRNVAE